jgi:hypothetical protein
MTFGKVVAAQQARDLARIDVIILLFAGPDGLQHGRGRQSH